MRNSSLQENILLLQEELRSAGFAESLVAEVETEMLLRTDGDFELSLECMIDDSPVKVRVFFEELPPDGYRFAHFDVRLCSAEMGHTKRNGFVWTPGYAVSLVEAVNLMKGRYVYRGPRFDPLRHGYWIHLDRPAPYPGAYLFSYTRNGFRVMEAAAAMVEFLDEKMIVQLEQGDRVRMGSGLGCGYVEADPIGRRLRTVAWEERLRDDGGI